MYQEVKERWVEALRSGKYVQARGSLYNGKDDDGTVTCCAMGVLNDISGLGTWDDDGMYLVTNQDIWEEGYFDEDLWADKVCNNIEEHPELGKYIEGDSWRSQDMGYYDGWEVVHPTREQIEEMSEPVKALYFDCIRGEEEFAHTAVSKWAGLGGVKDPYLTVGDKKVEIHELNDGPRGGEGWMTFAQIADLIEEQL